MVELGVAVLLLAGLAAAFRPPSPAPLGPEARWETKAAPGIGELARDLTISVNASAWTPGLASRLRSDLHRVEADGPPPDPAKAAVWERAMHRVEAALARPEAKPATIHSELGTAGLELTTLWVGGSPRL